MSSAELSTDWTQVTKTITSPLDAVTLKLELSGTQFSGWLAWDDASVSLEEQVITKYYYAGSQRVAVRKGDELSYLLGDHLGSTSVTTNSAGNFVAEMLYKPFGEVRYTSGTTPTQYTYTGQYSNMAEIGLMYYNTRWYDPALGRFVQADSLIPQPGNPMAWDRYGYVMNNPVRYTDPSGHWACEDNDETGRCFNSIHGNREGQHFSDGGLNMLRLYHEFDKTPGYWSSDGNFTLEEFIGFYVLAETNSSEPNIILIEAITRRIWTGGGGYIPYCSEKNCVVGIFNFFGEYSDSSILAYRYLVESSVGFSDDYYPAGREGIFELYAFDIGRRILNPPSSWKQYDPDKPYHFGNNEGLVEAWEDVGNEDGYLYNQLVVSYGNFYIATINQDNYWHCRIGALSGSICGIYPNP